MPLRQLRDLFGPQHRILERRTIDFLTQGGHSLHGNKRWSFGPSRFATLLGFGRDWQSASFDDAAFFVSKAGQTQQIRFTSLRARTLRCGWLFGSIQIEIANSAPILLKAIRRSKARIAFETLSRTIDQAATNHLDRSTEQILSITRRIADAVAGRRSLAYTEVAVLREQAAPHLFLL